MLNPILIYFNEEVSKLPLIFIIFGILLMALSGLEKIIIYLNFADQAGSKMDTLFILVPGYIWSITNYTFIGGSLLICIGVIAAIYRKIENKKENKFH